MNKGLFVLFLIAVGLLYAINSSDGLLHLIHADKTSGKIQDGERVRILEGNVEAYQDTLFMYCDRAVFYENSDLAVFTGNVRLEDGQHVLWADKIEYYTATRTAYCYGNVRISGEKDSLFARQFVYRFREENAYGKTDMYIWDKENNVSVWGDSGRYLSGTRESHVKGDARFQQIKADEADTLIITSRHLAYFGMQPKKAVAFDSVEIRKGEVRARCDSAVYFIEDEKVWLRINPVVWQADSKMSGARVNFDMDSLEIKEIYLTGDAKVLTPVDSLDKRMNVLKGKSIQVSLVDKKPHLVVARNNASSIYILKEDSLDQGTNASSSDSIFIFFSEGTMDSIAIIGGIEGIFYPADYKGEIKSEF